VHWATDRPSSTTREDMRRALLIDTLGASAECSRTLAHLWPLLQRLGFEHLEQCVGSVATRQGVLDAVGSWVDRAEAGDSCLFYYFGHGKRVRFMDGTEPATDEDLIGLEVAKGAGVGTVLNVELSRELARLERRCGDEGSVVAIIDCCHASGAVRDGRAAAAITTRPGYDVLHPQLEDWSRALLAELGAPRHEPLAVDGHPGIVQLAATSAWRSAFQTAPESHLGLMTAVLVETLVEALARGVRVDEQLCWGMLVHRIRERVVQAKHLEEQWVTVSGPQDRALFVPRRVEMPRAVGFVSIDAGHGYLRAGSLGGVRVGDRWAVVEPWLGQDGAVELLARGMVVAVEVNRAELRLDTPLDLATGQVQACAVMTRAACPMVVCFGTPRGGTSTSGAESLAAGSEWLRPAIASVMDAGGRVQVLDDAGRSLLDVASGEQARVRQRLEDLARRQYLLDLLDQSLLHRGGEVDWRVWHHPHEDAEPRTLAPGTELRVGDGVSFELINRPDRRSRHWFLAIVHIDVGGRLTLMHMRQPEGVELGSRATELVGQRFGGGRRGIRLTWPNGTPEHTPLPASFVMLAARRPLNLANLVRWQVHDLDEAFEIQRVLRVRDPQGPRSGSTTHPPQLADDWAWRTLGFMLVP
jgi:hypothetical protein